MALAQAVQGQLACTESVHGPYTSCARSACLCQCVAFSLSVQGQLACVSVWPFHYLYKVSLHVSVRGPCSSCTRSACLCQCVTLNKVSLPVSVCGPCTSCKRSACLSNSKHWFTTSFLPESGVRSVPACISVWPLH